VHDFRMMFSEGTGSAHVNQPLSAAALPAISNASSSESRSDANRLRLDDWQRRAGSTETSGKAGPPQADILIEWRGQGGQEQPQQRDPYANLGDPISSMWMEFSVHTAVDAIDIELAFGCCCCKGASFCNVRA
jgi:hypothetical protein